MTSTNSSAKSGATVSSQLTVTQTIELLDSLKDTVRDFAASEEKLVRDYRQKIDATQKRFKEESETHDARLTAQLSEMESAFRATKEHLQTKYERRKARIARAHKSSQRQSARRIDDEEGGRKHRSQKGMLDTKRWRTDSLAQNDATLVEFNQQLAENHSAFAALEGRALKAFRGYGKFRKMVASGSVLANTDFSPDEYQ